MTYRVPAYYPEVPQEVLDNLRLIEEVVVPNCIEGNELSVVTPKIVGSALLFSYAMVGDVQFTYYTSIQDVWEDAYYDAWYGSEDKNDVNLLSDLAINCVKSLEWWEV